MFKRIALSLIILMYIFSYNAHAAERMADKVVLITGGSQGIGKGIATVFAKEGANVIIISRTKEKLADGI